MEEGPEQPSRLDRNELVDDEHRPRPEPFHGHAVFEVALEVTSIGAPGMGRDLQVRRFERQVFALLGDGTRTPDRQSMNQPESAM